MLKRNLILLLVVRGSLLYSQEAELVSEPLFIDLKESQLEIQWLYPELDGIELHDLEIDLKIGVKTSHEIQSVEFKLNGKDFDQSRGLSIKKETESKFDQIVEQHVTLEEGQNTITCRITNKAGKIQDIERKILIPIETVTAELIRKDYALLIATDAYDEWNDLVNPVNDAQTIGKELKDNYGFEVEIIENPTLDSILVKLREYARKSYQENDQLFIFFAGHGNFDDLLGQGYLVCKNSRLNDEAKTSYLSHSVLRSAVDNIQARHIFLTIDACFGGTFDQAVAKAGNRGGNDVYDQISTTQYIKKKLQFKTRKYLTSGGKQYVSDGIEGMHSPFARRFLEALRGYGGSDDIVTLPELYIYLERTIPEPRAGSFGSDEPGSDFVFVVK
jgi:hypothetical protein